MSKLEEEYTNHLMKQIKAEFDKAEERIHQLIINPPTHERFEGFLKVITEHADEVVGQFKLNECINVDKHMKETINVLHQLETCTELYSKQKIESIKRARTELIFAFGHADIKRS